MREIDRDRDEKKKPQEKESITRRSCEEEVNSKEIP